MIKQNKIYTILFLLLAVSCIKETEKDPYPKLDLLSPFPCDTLYFGQSFRFRMAIADSSGLGDISMDIHHNFGHHSHGDHETCVMDAVKDPIHPYSNGWVFSLPDTETDYVFDTLLSLPSMKNDTVFYDEGDYHFHFYVTDTDGYQSFTTLDVKVLYE